jgi:NTE family protein
MRKKSATTQMPRLGVVLPLQQMSDIISVAKTSGRGAVWLARLLGVQEVGSSNLPAPTIKFGPETDVSGFFLLRRPEVSTEMDLIATPVDVLKEKLSKTEKRFRRRLEGLGRKSVGIALGSGAARGMAHIGVLEVLFREGIPIDAVVGCSMGAVVGGCYASGMDPEALEEIAIDINKLDVARHVDLVAPTRGGLMAGSRLNEVLKELTFEKTFDNLRFPFACATADILTGDEVPIEDGFVHEAIRASSSIPGIFQPVVHGKRVLVDGGILNPVPANYLLALGVDVSIAVDVMPVLRPSEEQLGRVPSIPATLINSFDIMGRLVAAPLTCLATVVIKPEVGEVFGAEFWRAAELIEKGREAAREAIPAIREVLEG